MNTDAVPYQLPIEEFRYYAKLDVYAVMFELHFLACDQIREKDGGVVVGCGGDGSPCIGGSPGDQDHAWPRGRAAPGKGQ